MSARFKTLRVIFFFLLSFATVTLVWGEGGDLERKEKEERLERLEAAAESKERENALLRERNLASKDSDEAKVELIYSFSTTGENAYQVVSYPENYGLEGEYKGISFSKCILWAIVPTFLYVLFLVFWEKWRRKGGRKMKEMENGRDNRLE